MTGPNLHLSSTDGCTFVGILFSLLGLKYTTAIAEGSDKDKHIDDNTMAVRYSQRINLTTDSTSIPFKKLLMTHSAIEDQIPTTTQRYWRKIFTQYAIQLSLLSIFFQIYGNRSLIASEMRVMTAGRVQAAFAVVTDIYIAISMCSVLQEKKTEFGPTKGVISKLINYAINRGVILTILQLLQVLLTISTKTELDQIFYFPLSTVYVNSVLAVPLEVQCIVLKYKRLALFAIR
ncbi:hypothetical protein WOLCODRAFT_20863 [Wolfiporia cocos MD-104 SS10]|uniref:DUF6534 domain-containing protein n=1 Tax=Wolfiporia cocos (strain MD-104) TaxID=742152 RepID=A0A2H3JE18_WOLCO|nr:hypothetical protein WOLCODRAFT_20863 [Wolfiporia cocos MD-104 SS10]